MDLGIEGRRALLTGASKGMGRACAEALAREGVDLTLNGRDAGVLKETVDAIAGQHDVTVTGVAGDIAAEATQRARVGVELVRACEQRARFFEVLQPELLHRAISRT